MIGKIPQRADLVVGISGAFAPEIPVPVEPNGGQAGRLRARDVGVQVVADMPHVLGFNAKLVVRKPKDLWIRLRNANLTRDHDRAETMLNAQDA